MIKITILSLNPHRWNKESESETEREKLVRQGLATGNNRLRGFESWPTTSRSPSPSLPSPKTRMERLRERKWRKQTSPLSLSLSLSLKGERQVFTGMILRGARGPTPVGGLRQSCWLKGGASTQINSPLNQMSLRAIALQPRFLPMFLSVSLFLFAPSLFSLSLSLSVRAYTTT